MTSVELDGSALKSSVTFTGRLACMSRTKAFDVVRQRGGTPSPAVTKRTQVVIVGELGWPLLDDGRPSNKLSRATALGIPIVSERRFLEWVGKTVPHDVQKTYSAQQLAALSKMSTSMIQELAQLSLLDERDGRFGFRDLASARQIAKLLNDGVRLSEIIRAVSEIRKWLPDVGLAGVRLHAGVHSDVQVEQSGGARTNMVSSSWPSMAPGRILMNCSIEPTLRSRGATSPRPKSSIAFSSKATRRMHQRHLISGTCYGPLPGWSRLRQL